MVSRPAKPRCQPSTSASDRVQATAAGSRRRAAAASAAGAASRGPVPDHQRRRPPARPACPGRRAAASARTAARRAGAAPGDRRPSQRGDHGGRRQAQRDGGRDGRGRAAAAARGDRRGAARHGGQPRSGASANSAMPVGRSAIAGAEAEFGGGPRRGGDDVPHVAGPELAGDHRRRAVQRARPAPPPSRRPSSGAPEATLYARQPGRRAGRGERGEVGRAATSRDVDEVAALAAVLEDPGRPAGLQRRAEDRRDPGVRGVARHPGPVDVVVAQGDHGAAGLRGPRPRPGAPGRAWSRRRRCAGRAARPRRPAPASSGAPQRGQARLEPAGGQVGDSRGRPGGPGRARRRRTRPRRRRPSSWPAPAGRTPARAIAASSTAVPRSLQPTYSGRSSRSTPMPTIAAWCTTTSTPRSAAATASGSRTSATARAARRPSAGGGRDARPGGRRPGRSPRGRPRPGAAVTWEPMKPAPPVTRTRVTAPTVGAAGGARTGAARHRFVRIRPRFVRTMRPGSGG